MESTTVGALVTVTGNGPPADGIVYEIPSRTKVVVAVVDRARGPVLRSVPMSALSEREQEGADDPALHLLIRRTASSARGSGRTGTTAPAGRAGFSRGAAHRPTGR